MNRTILLAGAMIAFAAAPLAAHPGQGKGQGKAKPQAYGVNGPIGYGVGGCPPGLAKKNNGCLPPGQAKKLYNVGQRFPTSYGYPWTYNQIPMDLRTQYGFDPNYRYYYGDGYLYRVDPATMLISQVVSAVLR